MFRMQFNDERRPYIDGLTPRKVQQIRTAPVESQTGNCLVNSIVKRLYEARRLYMARKPDYHDIIPRFVQYFTLVMQETALYGPLWHYSRQAKHNIFALSYIATPRMLTKPRWLTKKFEVSHDPSTPEDESVSGPAIATEFENIGIPTFYLNPNVFAFIAKLALTRTYEAEGRYIARLRDKLYEATFIRVEKFAIVQVNFCNPEIRALSLAIPRSGTRVKLSQHPALNRKVIVSAVGNDAVYTILRKVLALEFIPERNIVLFKGASATVRSAELYAERNGPNKGSSTKAENRMSRFGKTSR